MTHIRAGMSGWSYKEWKPDFYPEGLPADRMLAHYATRFPAVEVNNTFYRMPRESVLLDWARQVPDGFTFCLKASRRITHDHRLQDVADLMAFVLRNANVLGPRRGPMLFQLPPNMKLDLERLDGFLALVPPDWRLALECRHASWFTEEVHARLRTRDIAMVVAEQDDWTTPVTPTATWGYLRLHRAGYTEADLAQWIGRIRDQGWTEATVFFKHEEEIAGPAIGLRFQELATHG